MKHPLSVEMELNALYHSEYREGLKQLEVFPHPPTFYQIRLKNTGATDNISEDLIERFVNADFEHKKNPGEDKWSREVEEARKNLLKIFDKLRKLPEE